MKNNVLFSNGAYLMFTYLIVFTKINIDEQFRKMIHRSIDKSDN